jgi:diaminohydroxyphosphoribosylaminopyrimidine deaminase/5-amino-6-(5-phosphoribosylamino)uracil reductase
MKQATTLARIGYGNTFPNPAVGCVLVRHHHDNENDSSQTTIPLDEVIGSGFHPKAGMPHAEVFALLEACDHIEDGVAGARSVMGAVSEDEATTSSLTSKMLNEKVLDLLDVYKSKDGACKLFDGHFNDWNVTAYVTLEPCCHTGQTPPCAMSLVAAGVNRVVVGYRDPNPKVDGGGLQLLQNSGIDVNVLSKTKGRSATKEEIKAASECYNLVKYFVKRISPREESSPELDDTINGKKRRILRSIAGRQKAEGIIQQLDWPRDHSTTKEEHNEESDLSAQHISINHRYLERIDAALWDHEIVLLRLNKFVKKKKEAKILGGRIAEVLNAHVAQVIGHTSLLYRPGFPPLLDLDELLDEEDVNLN